MASNLWKGQAFSVSHADGSGTQPSQFEGGLRAFFEYRDLGINDATKGKFIAHVIRAVPGRHAEGGWYLNMKVRERSPCAKALLCYNRPASGIARLAIVMILNLLKSARLPSLKPSW